MRHQSLRRGIGKAPQRRQWNPANKQNTSRREAINREPGRPGGKRNEQGAPVAELARNPARQRSRDDGRPYPDRGKREANLGGPPVETIIGVENEDGWQRLMREVG